ncbi:MAG TPA: MBOAT family O-acyltransferase, partial [Pseudobdellovibrionaceae bacterium]
MSYTIEVYFGNQKAEKDFSVFALYVLYFPQLVAGPIERPQNLLHQFRRMGVPDNQTIRSGLFLIFTGLAKKCIVADNLTILSDKVFSNPQAFGTLAHFLGTLFFAFQIYCDFAGYSDIARGCSKFFGIELMLNFNKPYFAKTVSEFWRRWHLSLSTWFRDYVYFPLGGNRNSQYRTIFNSLVVFTLSGLWHGANWTFIFWGLFHGLVVGLEHLLKKSDSRLWTIMLV